MNAIRILGDAGWMHDLWFRGNPPASAEALRADAVWAMILWTCIGWFVFLMTLMVVFVVRYRRRPGVPAPRSPAHCTWLEIAWTIVPTGFFVWMFFAGFDGYIRQMVAPGDAIEMKVTGLKWDWQMTYPNGAESPEKDVVGAKPIPVFVMPAETPVRLRMSSVDVTHAFWIPAFRVKQDVYPNRYTTVWFRSGPPANGVSEDRLVFCAEYCGNQHSEMAAILRFVPKDVYLKTIDGWNTAGLTPEMLGQFLWKSRGCISCHSSDGSAGTGPTWKGVFGKTEQFEDGSSATVDATYLAESMKIPLAKVVKGYPKTMPLTALSDRELEGLIAYIKSLKGP